MRTSTGRASVDGIIRRFQALQRYAIYVAMTIGLLAMAVAGVLIVPSISSAYREVRTNASSDFEMTLIRPRSDAGYIDDVVVRLSQIDEVKGTLTLSIEARRTAQNAAYPSRHRLLVGTFLGDSLLASIASLDLPSDGTYQSATLTAPINGSLFRYPFDSYTFGLGFAVEEIDPSGQEQVIPLTETRRANLSVRLDEGID
jgi:hypothetical protein